MARILVIVPFALVDKGIDNRLNQVQSVKFGPYIDFEFCGPKAPGLERHIRRPHDWKSRSVRSRPQLARRGI